MNEYHNQVRRSGFRIFSNEIVWVTLYFCLMLHLHSFTFNPFQENTYILYNDEREALIIDPGMYSRHEEILLDEFLTAHALKPVAIRNTHTHLDHIFGVSYLSRTYNLPLSFHTLDLPVYQSALQVANMYGLQMSTLPEPDSFITIEHGISLGKDKLSVFFTPGHSPGSVCFYSEKDKMLISGDVLFQQSIGRTDLPGGDYDTLMKSIHTQLMVLPDETHLYSGHGPATTIGLERMNNPFLR